MGTLDSLAIAHRIDAIFAPWNRPDTPGAAVGVLRGDEVIFARGYGLASVELGAPIGSDTAFRIASVSKQFTVAAALRLVRDGRLSLDDPPQKYLPDLPPLPEAITIEQMMRNTSGWPDFLELLQLGGSNLDRPTRVEDLRATVARNRHLNFAPGSRFLYSNTNFVALAWIVDAIEGRPLSDILADWIFKPLGMTRTALVVDNDTVVPHLATAYLQTLDGSLRRARHAYPHGGEGGLVSTVEDLLIWARHCARPWLKPTALWADLAEPKPLTNGAPSPYLRGLWSAALRGLDTVGHGGLWPGYRTEFLRVPARDLAVVVIANLATIDPWNLARETALAVLAGDSAVGPAASLDLSAVGRACGTWINEAEPSLFALELRAGVPTATQNGVPFSLVARADGWLQADRGAFEFALKPPTPDATTMDVDLGAGRVLPFRRLADRAAVPPDIAGIYRSTDTGATWRIHEEGADWLVDVGGPLIASGAPWTIRGLADDLVEIEMASGGWMTVSQLARIERDATGRVVRLRVHTGRIKAIPFDRVAA